MQLQSRTDDPNAVIGASPTARPTKEPSSSVGTARSALDGEVSEVSARSVGSGSPAPNDGQVPGQAHSGSNLPASSELPQEMDSSTGAPMSASGGSNARGTNGDDGFGDFGDVGDVVLGLLPLHACVLCLAAKKAARHHHLAATLHHIANPEAVLFGEVRSCSFWLRSRSRGGVMLALCAAVYGRLLVRRG